MHGLWILDEPESALSLPSCLALIGLLRDLVDGSSQVALSTHSPVQAAYPDADQNESGEWGIRACEHDELELVRNWRAFLEAPERYFCHVTEAVPQRVPPYARIDAPTIQGPATNRHPRLRGSA